MEPRHGPHSTDASAPVIYSALSDGLAKITESACSKLMLWQVGLCRHSYGFYGWQEALEERSIKPHVACKQDLPR